MPSTPRMIQIEAKASQPGEPLTHGELSEWHLLAGHRSTPDWTIRSEGGMVAKGAALVDFGYLPLSADAPLSIRYLDSTGYRRPMNESL